MDWIRCVGCEKLQRDFVPRTFALIAPLHPVLHRVSCSYEKIPNAPEHYEMYQNVSLGSNGVYQVRWLRKITMWLRGTNFCINCTSSICFATSFMQLRNDPNAPKHYETIPNAPKHYETHQNMSLGSNGVDQVRWLRKITMWLRGTNFCILIAPVQYVLQQVSCSYETIPNAPKYYETDRNISLGSNVPGWVCFLRKNPDVT